MPYKLTIELSDRDLRHFRRELQKSRASVQIADDDEILGAAADLVVAMRRAELPDFVAERLGKLELLMAMMTDAEFPLEEAERSPVLAGLAYLCDPEDLIPDDIPGIGMLDDAVMIELVFRELRHELEAFADFRAYRASLPKPARKRDDAGVRGKLERRRAQLVARMRRRRKAG
ncbi:MAG: YkvA family protein [Steroidobacteraceae bacterium]